MVVETLTATQEHPFYVDGQGFVPAGRLAVGNAIVTRAGPGLVVQSVTWQRHPEGMAVYNFVVDEDHTYFIGKDELLVHNGGDCVPDLTTVSRWGREGLQPGDWVMKGPANRWNYIWSGKWQPGFTNEYAPFSSGQEFQVPASSLQYPKGMGIIDWGKGLIGQRRYMP